MKRYFLLCISILLFSSCMNKNMNQLLNSSWEVVRVENIDSSDIKDRSLENKRLEKGLSSLFFTFTDSIIAEYNFIDEYIVSLDTQLVLMDKGAFKTNISKEKGQALYKPLRVTNDSAEVLVFSYALGEVRDSSLLILSRNDSSLGEANVFPPDTLYTRLKKYAWELTKNTVVDVDERLLDARVYGDKSLEEIMLISNQLYSMQIESEKPFYLFYDDELFIGGLNQSFNHTPAYKLKYVPHSPIIQASQHGSFDMYTVLKVDDSVAILSRVSLDPKGNTIESILEFKVTSLDKDSLHKKVLLSRKRSGAVSGIDQLRVKRKGASRKKSTVNGGRSKANIMRILRGNMPSLKYAYNRRLVTKPGLQGEIAVRFKINQIGKVLSCTMENSTMHDPTFEKEVVKKILRWHFGKINVEGDVTEVVYPFVFTK